MTIKKSVPKRSGGRGWILAIAMMIMSLIVMGLIMVWSNIERMDTTYFINIAKDKLKERQTLHSKLEVEYGRLISPYELKRKAQEFGMREASTTQVRRLGVQ